MNKSEFGIGDITVSYDNGVSSGSGNPGWTYRDGAGDWQPIETLAGLQEWSSPGRPEINQMTSAELVELLDERGYEAVVEGIGPEA